MGTYYFFIVCLMSVTYVHSARVMFAPRKHLKRNTEFKFKYTICATDECIKTASEILAKLNRTVDPCDNFYKFACGEWLHNNRANQSFPKIDFFSVLEKKTENHLREILEEPAKAGDTMSLHKAKHIFNQCMSTRDSEAIGMSNLSAIVNRYAGWPLLMSHHEWDEKHLTWQNVSNILHENGFDNGLYNIRVWPDVQMSNSNVIAITNPSFYFLQNKMIQLNNTFLQERKYIHKIISISINLMNEIGGTIEIKNLFRDAIDIVNFEIELAKLTSTFGESNITFYNPLTVQQLQEEYDKQHPGINGKIDWSTTIQKMFASEGITIEPSEKVVVQTYNYLMNLVPVLERTPSRTIVNYMQWTVIRELFPYKKQSKANNTASAITNPFSRQVEKNDTRWKACLSKPNLKSAISHEYVKKYASNVDMQAIREIVADIESAVREQVRQSTWMDEPTREASLEKIANMRHEFFQPDWYSDEAIDKYYKDLNVSMGYLENIVNIMTFEKKKMIGSLKTPVTRKEWFLEPTVPQAYNFHVANKFVFNAAILQDPVYNKSRLPLLNYGTLGFSIAHEINHAFDNTFRRYNQHGNVATWWTQNSIDKHDNITQCFIDQYNNYLVSGLEEKNVYVNGQLTLGENIADSAGIVAAYYAYKNRKTRLNELEWRMEGLEDYSDDQIFFIAYTQLFCETALPREIEKEISWEHHPVKEIRIRGSLANSREFSEIYNCSSGTPMNPEKKCALWY